MVKFQATLISQDFSSVREAAKFTELGKPCDSYLEALEEVKKHLNVLTQEEGEDPVSHELSPREFVIYALSPELETLQMPYEEFPYWPESGGYVSI